MKAKIVSCHTADSKPVKKEVNGTVILPPLVFPGYTLSFIVAKLKLLEHVSNNYVRLGAKPIKFFEVN